MWPRLQESRAHWILSQGAPHLCDSFRFWWLYRGTSQGLDGSLSIFPSHRKLDEEYKERIAALKNEFRKEREQILQQVGKQRLELEQEIEKAKTEENYIRDRLALSLKVIILLVIWSVCLLGTPHGKPQLCKRTSLHRALKSGSTPGHSRAPLGSRFQACPGFWFANSISCSSLLKLQ